MKPLSLMDAHQTRDTAKLLCESPRRRSIDESMRVVFLGTSPEEEWERYQSELGRKTGEVWTRVAFIESTWDVIWSYGTQSVIESANHA